MKIFLTGFMGSGKTYWGSRWAQKYHFDFYDLDEVIETSQHESIAGIFDKFGEGHFRQVETAVLRSFSEKDNYILACGGGTACFNDNMKWMNENGTTVYLSANQHYIFDRVISGKHKRPLISKLSETELLYYIEQKLKEREVFYRQAKIILPVEDLDNDFVPRFLVSNS